jgi:hypothetical protein
VVGCAQQWHNFCQRIGAVLFDRAEGITGDPIGDDVGRVKKTGIA